MRALLLLILGAGLVWFVWRGLGPENPAEGESHAAAPGSMIAVDSPVTPDEPTARSSQERVQNPSVGGAGAEAVPLAATPAADPKPDAGPMDAVGRSSEPATVPAGMSSPGHAFSSAAEVSAAEELLRDPAGLGTWLAARGVELTPGRREFAAGLVHAFAGLGADASAALDRAGKSGELRPTEDALARRISGQGPESSSVLDDSPLARAASMKEQERAGLQHLAAGRAREAAEAFSRLLLAEVSSPWPADAGRLATWSDRLHAAQRGNRWNRRGAWRSTEVVVQPGDSLISVRKRALVQDPSLVVCTGQIARANELEGEVIHPGAKLRIPVDRVSVLVDLDAHWAFYLAGDEVVAAWPVGVGKESSATRVGTFTVGEKTKEPMWFPQGRKPVPFGDPENPLGTRWVSWNDAEGNPTRLGFHGTNEPASVGRDASLGCIRMRTNDIEELFEILPRGALVRVVP